MVALAGTLQATIVEKEAEITARTSKLLESEQARQTLVAEIEKLPDYDATLRLRLGTAFQERGGVWEAALLYEDLITRHPESPERETAYFNLVRAYADAGRFEKVRDAVARFTRAYPTSPHAPQALYLAALSAARRADASSQLAFLDLAVNGPSPSAELGEPMALLRA